MKQNFTFFLFITLSSFFSQNTIAQITLPDTTLWTVDYDPFLSFDDNSVSFPNQASIWIQADSTSLGQLVIPNISCGNKSNVTLNFSYDIYNITNNPITTATLNVVAFSSAGNELVLPLAVGTTSGTVTYDITNIAANQNDLNIAFNFEALTKEVIEINNIYIDFDLPPLEAATWTTNPTASISVAFLGNYTVDITSSADSQAVTITSPLLDFSNTTHSFLSLDYNVNNENTTSNLKLLISTDEGISYDSIPLPIDSTLNRKIINLKSWIDINPVLRLQFWGDNIDEVFLQLILQLLKATDKGDIVLSDPSVRDGDRVGPGHEARVYNSCVPLCTPIEFTIPWENRCNNNPPTVTANIYYEGNEVATWSSPSVPPLSDNETEGTIILKGADDCNNNDMCNSTNPCHFKAQAEGLYTLKIELTNAMESCDSSVPPSSNVITYDFYAGCCLQEDGSAFEIDWQRVLLEPFSDGASDIQQTTDGGYIAISESVSNDGTDDYRIVKLDALGNIEWQKTYGGLEEDTPSTVRQTNDNGYIIAGYSNSIDGYVSGNHGSFDAWIVKLDALGNLEWQKSLGGSSDDYATSVQQTSEDGYIIGGYTSSNNGDVSGNHGGYDAWIIKLDILGNLEWQKTYGGSSDDRATSIQKTTDGSYIVAGFTVSNDGDVTNNHGSYDYWILKLDILGNLEWQKTFGGNDNDYACSIAQTQEGGYIVAGHSYSNDIDITNNQGANDYWIVKLDHLGEIEWQKTLGGSSNDYAKSIEQTQDGGYIVGGGTYSNDGDVSNNQGANDYWIVKLDAFGNLEWQKTLGGSNSDNANTIHQTADGNYIAIGYTNSSNGDVVIDSGLGNNTGYTWIVKLSTTNLNAFFSSPNSVCIGSAVSFINQSSNAATYQWQIDGVNVSQDIDYIHTFTEAGSYNVRLYAITPSCQSVYEKEIIVNPLPDATFSVENNGNNIIVTAANTEGLNYNWDFGDGVNYDRSHTEIYSYAAAGEYTVCLNLEDVNNCESTYCDDVVFLNCESVNAAFDIPASICQNEIVTFINNSTNATTYQWQVDGNNVSTNLNLEYNFATLGTHTITLFAYDSEGCETFFEQQVEVNILPTVSFSTTLEQYTTTFDVTVTDATSYNWTFGDGNSSSEQNPVYTYANDGTYEICLEVENSCGTATYCETVFVENLTETCGDYYQNITSGLGSIDHTIKTANNEYFSILKSSKTIVKYTETGNIIWTKVYGTVENFGFISDNIYDGVTICTTEEILALDTDGTVIWNKKINNSEGMKYNAMCRNDNGYMLLRAKIGVAELEKLSDDGNLMATYRLNLGSFPYLAHILPTSDGGYLLTGLFGGVEIGTQQQNILAIKIDNNMNVQWSNAYASSSQRTSAYTAIETSAGDYLILGSILTDTYVLSILKIDNQGSILWDKMNQNVIFADLPRSSAIVETVDNNYVFAYQNIDGLPYAFKFDNLAQVQWAYTYSTAQNSFFSDIIETNDDLLMGGLYVDIPNNLVGNYMVKTDANGIGSCIQNVAPQVLADTNLDKFAYSVSIDNITTLPSFTTPTISSQNEQHIPECLCPVSCEITTAFTYLDTGLQIAFTNHTNSTGLSNYVWEFGDGNTSNMKNPTHTYNAADTYEVCLTATNITDNNCSDIYCEMIDVIDICVNLSASFTVSNPICQNESITFPNTSNNATSYQWKINNNDIDTSTDLIHTFSEIGTHTITLIATDNNNCQDIYEETIEVLSVPIANFELPTNICAGETIIIINNSSNADSYQWTIVKNSFPISIYTNTFAVGNLSYTFSEAGNYTIYLTASNSNGCANSTFSQNIDIQPFIDNHFSINNNSTPVFSFIPNTNTGTHNWNFGDGTVSNEINPQHEYLQSGTYTICHQIEGSCSTEHCETIDVCDLTADFINPNEICENTLTTFVSLNNNVSSYQWSVDGIVDVAANTQIFNKAFTAGEHIIGLSITDAFGCTSTKEMTITVLLEAVATFTVQNNNLTSTFTADYDDTTATYEWDFGDNTAGTGSTVSHTYSTDGTYMVNLTITNACGSVQSTQNGCGE